MDIIPYDGKIFYDGLGMRLWERRHQFLDQFIQSQRILDIGCNDARFLIRQSHSTQLTYLAGLDLDPEVLAQARRINIIGDQLQECIKPNRKQPCYITLFQGDATKMYRQFQELQFELITLIEVVEHFEPHLLPALCENVFGFLNPPQIIVTTPNSDFNIYFREIEPDFKFRHSDHKFEFTQSEFQQWCAGVANLYDYSMTFYGVGQHKSGSLEHGYATQICVFTRNAKQTQNYAPSTDLEPQTVLEFCCPYDPRDEAQKQAEHIVQNYTRYSLINQKKITDQEYDYLEEIEQGSVLIRKEMVGDGADIMAIMATEPRLKFFRDPDYILLKLDFE